MNKWSDPNFDANKINLGEQPNPTVLNRPFGGVATSLSRLETMSQDIVRAASLSADDNTTFLTHFDYDSRCCDEVANIEPFYTGTPWTSSSVFLTCAHTGNAVTNAIAELADPSLTTDRGWNVVNRGMPLAATEFTSEGLSLRFKYVSTQTTGYVEITGPTIPYVNGTISTSCVFLADMGVDNNTNLIVKVGFKEVGSAAQAYQTASPYGTSGLNILTATPNAGTTAIIPVIRIEANASHPYDRLVFRNFMLAVNGYSVPYNSTTAAQVPTKIGYAGVVQSKATTASAWTISTKINTEYTTDAGTTLLSVARSTATDSYIQVMLAGLDVTTATLSLRILQNGVVRGTANVVVPIEDWVSALGTTNEYGLRSLGWSTLALRRRTLGTNVVYGLVFSSPLGNQYKGEVTVGIASIDTVPLSLFLGYQPRLDAVTRMFFAETRIDEEWLNDAQLGLFGMYQKAFDYSQGNLPGAHNDIAEIARTSYELVTERFGEPVVEAHKLNGNMYEAAVNGNLTVSNIANIGTTMISSDYIQIGASARLEVTERGILSLEASDISVNGAFPRTAPVHGLRLVMSREYEPVNFGSSITVGIDNTGKSYVAGTGGLSLTSSTGQNAITSYSSTGSSNGSIAFIEAERTLALTAPSIVLNGYRLSAGSEPTTVAARAADGSISATMFRSSKGTDLMILQNSGLAFSGPGWTASVGAIDGTMFLSSNKILLNGYNVVPDNTETSVVLRDEYRTANLNRLKLPDAPSKTYAPGRWYVKDGVASLHTTSTDLGYAAPGVVLSSGPNNASMAQLFLNNSGLYYRRASDANTWAYDPLQIIDLNGVAASTKSITTTGAGTKLVLSDSRGQNLAISKDISSIVSMGASVADANALTTNGDYEVLATTDNLPVDSAGLITVRVGAVTIYQVYIQASTGVSFSRTNSSGLWGRWNKSTQTVGDAATLNGRASSEYVVGSTIVARTSDGDAKVRSLVANKNITIGTTAGTNTIKPAEGLSSGFIQFNSDTSNVGSLCIGSCSPSGTMSNSIVVNQGGTSYYLRPGISQFKTNAWAGPGVTSDGYAATNVSRFGFSSDTGACDVYTDGNFYANDGRSLVLHAGNFNAYAPTKVGTGASGTWDISVTGCANSAHSATYAEHAGDANTLLSTHDYTVRNLTAAQAIVANSVTVGNTAIRPDLINTPTLAATKLVGHLVGTSDNSNGFLGYTSVQALAEALIPYLNNKLTMKYSS